MGRIPQKWRQQNSMPREKGVKQRKAQRHETGSVGQFVEHTSGLVSSRISRQMPMECCQKMHLERFHRSMDWVCGLRNFKTDELDCVRGGAELSLVINRNRIKDR